MLHIPPTNILLLAAIQEQYKKSLNEKYRRIFWKSSEEWTSRQKKTERVTELGRRTSEEKLAKWNEMTALRFQTGRRHQTSPASLRGLRGSTKRSSHRYWGGQFFLMSTPYPTINPELIPKLFLSANVPGRRFSHVQIS